MSKGAGLSWSRMMDKPLKILADYWRADFDTVSIAKFMKRREDTIYNWINRYGGMKKILRDYP